METTKLVCEAMKKNIWHWGGWIKEIRCQPIPKIRNDVWKINEGLVSWTVENSPQNNWWIYVDEQFQIVVNFITCKLGEKRIGFTLGELVSM